MLSFRLATLLAIAALAPAPVWAARASVTVECAAASPPVRFGLARLESALQRSGVKLHVVHDGHGEVSADIQVVEGGTAAEQAAGGFRILRDGTERAPRIRLAGADAAGTMYGLLDLADQLRGGAGLDAVQEKRVEPHLPFRAIKFNLPWSPYRAGPAMDVQVSTCRDLRFWERFLDMMAENRFNVLSLWNRHPFPYMVRAPSFPEATPFSDPELDEWRRFWTALFRMARDRAIETYVVNWNIVVSPEFARAYGARELNDTSEIVRRYTRESVTRVIDEYPDLTGLGVTLADWMPDMTPREREDWIEQTFVAGIKDASRPARFIHRSVLAGSAAEMRRVIDDADLPDPVWVEVKFNWSHGHSTPRLALTHASDSGRIDRGFWDPLPTNYSIAWMIRNEDFFILRWGEPGFIREHIGANVPAEGYVGGYFVGSEDYVPAVDQSHTPSRHRTWQYAFEKQWLFYRMWGRLLYDPSTPDSLFVADFEERYGRGTGRELLEAWRRARRMPLRRASFHAAAWDHTLYSEGVLAPRESRGLHDGASPFISIDELIDHETLDPSYLSIPEFVALVREGTPVPPGRLTPLALADSLQTDGEDVLARVARLRDRDLRYAGALECELLDLEAWARLSLYFAEKLRAGVALHTYRTGGDPERRTAAVGHLETALEHWEELAAVGDKHYRPVRDIAAVLSWSHYTDQARRDVEVARNAPGPRAANPQSK